MKESNAAQLRLRSAFRYAYYAFLAVVMPLSVLVGVLGLLGRDTVFRGGEPLGFIALIGAIGIGLIVPLFMAAWMLVGSALLRHQAD